MAIVAIPYRQDGKEHRQYHCSSCKAPAKALHEKEECHKCRDWGGCGNDCTLSGVVCPKCGDSITL